MTPHGLPEVIMFGLRAETMQFFINEVCGRMLHEQVRCGHGDVITELSGDAQPLTVLEVEDTSPLGAAHRLYQEVRAIQLVYADPEGRFPWQEGHSFPLDEQPLLGRPGNRSEGSDPPRRPGPTTSAAEAGATPSTGRMGTTSSTAVAAPTPSRAAPGTIGCWGGRATTPSPTARGPTRSAVAGATTRARARATSSSTARR